MLLRAISTEVDGMREPPHVFMDSELGRGLECDFKSDSGSENDAVGDTLPGVTSTEVDVVPYGFGELNFGYDTQ